MKRVYSTDSAARAWHLRNVLEQHGIEAVVRNDKLYSVAGEIPINECWPEIWIRSAIDAQRALRIIREALSDTDEPPADWVCGNCSETNPGNYEFCWNCQSALPLSPNDFGAG